MPATLIPRDPLRYLSPEIVADGDRECLAACGWRGYNPRGIFLAPLEWVPAGGPWALRHQWARRSSPGIAVAETHGRLRAS